MKRIFVSDFFVVSNIEAEKTLFKLNFPVNIGKKSAFKLSFETSCSRPNQPLAWQFFIDSRTILS